MWNMRVAGAGGRGGGRGAAPAGARGGAGLDQLMPLGEYTVTLDVDGRTVSGKGRIAKTLGWSLAPSPQIIR
jgi:hypothetical protein